MKENLNESYVDFLLFILTFDLDKEWKGKEEEDILIEENEAVWCSS